MNHSRLLASLEKRIALERDSVAADCLRAERASYLARRGEIEEAGTAIRELREKYAQRPIAPIVVWLCLAEGLLIHSTNMGPQARDKVHRAYALAGSVGMRETQARAAAWLAQLDYLRLDLVGMKRHALEALQLADRGNCAARSRVGLVIALAYHFAKRMDLATPWYALAREHAVAEGDDATLSALMHNMAWLRAINAFHADFRDEPLTDEGSFALLSANSTLNFDNLIGGTSLGAYTHLLRAQILSLEGQFSEALELYESYLERGVNEGIGKLHAALLADKAWCQDNMNMRDASRASTALAEKCFDPAGQSDDRALVHTRLRKLYKRFGDELKYKNHTEQASAAWAEHEVTQSKILRSLDYGEFSVYLDRS